ncbi:hypothetical protein LTR78_008078 [Recurvomyces mirabilis]|uniref:DhaL domain-containing protein n=1 Tax=Recurvomyces mirabilis TaxID=574656 RepID=A0AAE0WJ16_9PEZI|nr:hypothetical protein LTR78_008078 [Recurvomyces mirabilis]KAK5150805.1 hypothetical protein LTS14_009869 [Recurvomyces mirabilis]
MAIIVEQTIPFPSSSLDLHNERRWTDLLPLVRPTIKAVRTPKGQAILVDKALVKSKFVHIAAVGSLGSFSSKVLDDRNVTAIAIEHSGAGLVTPEDIQQALQSAGVAYERGLVIARVGKKSRVEQRGPNVLEVETEHELALDHILHLLGNATESCRESIDDVSELLKLFGKNASTAHSTFHVEKAEGNPAVLHAEGAAGFEKAKHAVERDLKHVMKAHTTQDGDVTYSVHFSDVNGLSRLENYIIAGEVAQYLEAQKISYQLSHSTILNHKDAARGFSISICPLPSSYLTPQPKPQAHRSTPAQDDTILQKTLSPSKAQITFDDAEVRRRIQSGCNAVIKAEPTITEYDTIVGDGDCGYTLRDGAKQVLSFIEGKDLTRLPETVAQLVSELEVNMGGTSGALYCIYLTALAGALASESSIAKALKSALEQLMKYTRARLGDRTMMDALIPFIDTLEKSGDVKQAIEKARQGVDGTKKMEAQLGRSAYLDESATRGVPDPGAYGLLILLEGMSSV